MKVLIVGGYGVFGARLARLLARDGHHVCVAGRDGAKATALARDLGCDAIPLDRTGPLDLLGDFDVVVDAAGPFNSYGADPYRLPRAAIAHGMHYLDLSDNAAFCAGITALDADARARGLCVLSGLSSVPAISSAAVAALAGDDPIVAIDTAILPGNRSPRGRSVIGSILSQAGRPAALYEGGRWTRYHGWSRPRLFTLPGGLRRQGWLIQVPDQTLFPAHFGAGTVRFRAGLELGLFRYGLAGFAMLRRAWPFAIGPRMIGAVKVMADLCAPFGSGTGGMVVAVSTATHTRTWRLRVADGDGPFIPAVAARALLRQSDLPIGACPAVQAVPLTAIEDAMSDLAARTDRQDQPHRPIFPSVLGDAFATLPPAIRATHDTIATTHWTGQAQVTRGPSRWAWLLAKIFRFPQPAAALPVAVTKHATTRGETWQRRFGGTTFVSHLAPRGGRMTERFGPFTFTLGLTVADDALHYPVLAGHIGPLPLPRWALPVSHTREYAADGRFHFDVAIHAPLTGDLIVHYRGTLAAAPHDDPAAPPRM